MATASEGAALLLWPKGSKRMQHTMSSKVQGDAKWDSDDQQSSLQKKRNKFK